MSPSATTNQDLVVGDFNQAIRFALGPPDAKHTGTFGPEVSEAGARPKRKSGAWIVGLSGSKRKLVRAVYLTAILAATVGWLWLITWVALQLV